MDKFILVLINIEDHMPKEKKNHKYRIIMDYLLRRTNKGGRTSGYEQCVKLNVDPDGYTFYPINKLVK
jgi:hypothetical protein